MAIVPIIAATEMVMVIVTDNLDIVNFHVAVTLYYIVYRCVVVRFF